MLYECFAVTCRRENHALQGSFTELPRRPFQQRATTNAAFSVTWGDRRGIDVEGTRLQTTCCGANE